jgi:plasmid stabilization system protein ParE
MTKPYRLTPRAIDDLVDIWDDVNQRFGERVADGVLERLETTFDLLVENPAIGHTRPELAPEPWQLWPVGPSLIAFRSDVRPIWIARIVRAERDWQGAELDEPGVI